MLFALLLACLDHTPIPGGEAETFVAMQADFADFRSWTSVTVAEADTGHGDGARTVYVSALPPDGAEEFPVGTMIVKTIEGADTHAMAKRGGGFNADGAPGWEWFELTEATDGTPVLVWRGAEPPDGETYGSLPGQEQDTSAPIGDCNLCHAGAAANDFVHAVAL